jgi:hypothetical protein
MPEAGGITWIARYPGVLTKLLRKTRHYYRYADFIVTYPYVPIWITSGLPTTHPKSSQL